MKPLPQFVVGCLLEVIDELTLGLIYHVVWDIPKHQVAVITAGHQSVLPLIEVLLNLLLSCQLVEEHALGGSSGALVSHADLAH